MIKPLPPLTRAFVASFILLSATSFADDPASENGARRSIAEQIKGDWVQYRDTPNGRFMTIKEHLGSRTVLTTYDPNKKAVYSHQSEYIVDESGEIPIFRYKDKVVLLGPKAGAKDPRENAYIFRVTDDRFYEVRGMLPGDDKPPSMTTWERLKVNPIRKPAA